jgi:chromosome segregation ATPase
MPKSALKARLDAGEVAQKLAVSEALSAVEKDRDALANALEKAKQENETKAQLAEAKRLSELQQAEATKDAEIQRLQAKLAAAKWRKLALTEAVSVVAKERDELKSGLDRAAGATCRDCAQG